MRYIFKFPDIGEGISEGKILKWYVEKGQSIKSGTPVVQMETDKVVADIPSPRTGVAVSLFGKVGEVIKVDDPLIEIDIEGVAGEEARELAREKPLQKKAEAVKEESFGVVGTIDVAGDGAYLPASEEGGVVEIKAKPTRKALATPVARAMARDLGVDINKVTGTGPGGRVTKSDIKSYHESLQVEPVETPRQAVSLESKPQTPRVEYEPLSQIRKTIAKKMAASKQTAAHMTIMEEVEISELIRLRESHKKEFEANGAKLTYLPFILKAVAQSLKSHKSLNSQLDMDKGQIIYKYDYNIGIAVDTEEGLVVPVIRNVDSLSIMEVSLKIADFARRAHERKLTLDDLKDGTFTVTNYGSIGGIFGVPVINYPEAAILGIGRIRKIPVVKDDKIEIGTVLPLSLSVDHRIVDGGEATRFVNDIMRFLHDPVSLLLI